MRSYSMRTDRSLCDGRGWRRALLVAVAALALGVGGGVAVAGGDDAAALMSSGLASYQRGAFERAAADWSAAVERYDKAGDVPGRIDSRLNLAAAYQSLGFFREALVSLQEGVELASDAEDRGRLTALLNARGSARLFTRQPAGAQSDLEMALGMAEEDGDAAAAAAVLNNIGNLKASQGEDEEAAQAYADCVGKAEQVGDSALAAKALVNAAASAARAGDADQAHRLNRLALDKIAGVEADHDAVYLLITVGRTHQDLAAAGGGMERSVQAYEEAARLAEKIGDKRGLSYACGYLGEVRSEAGDLDGALRLTRRAAFIAQEAQSPHALYRWQWQTGRILKKQGDSAAAVRSYTQAVQTLGPIRHDLAIGYGNRVGRSTFRDQVGPLFYELADVLLQQADAADDPAVLQGYLTEARQTVELLKTAELEDYFQDECVNLLRQKAKTVEQVGGSSAVVYLIPLEDRTEVLLTLPSGLMRVKVEVGADELYEEVRQFRRKLESRTTHSYMAHGQRLYDWLVRPVDKVLVEQGVDTLIFIPDGALRTVPIAALHDGEKFLIERYAVAVTPGLTLMDPKPIRREEVQMMMAGLSESVQGFPALAHVAAELDNLEGMYGGTRLMNSQFTLAGVEGKISGQVFSVVHIASHGEFSSDSSKTYLLTYDDKLTLDGLERLIRPIQFRAQPVEMLTLSACQTAAGDDRAALGLAGIAIKAGARSALATLWYVNDQASATLVSDMYRYLYEDRSISKAKALQKAQTGLLGDSRYRHPCYWSPYMIIGNWL